MIHVNDCDPSGPPEPEKVLLIGGPAGAYHVTIPSGVRNFTIGFGSHRALYVRTTIETERGPFDVFRWDGLRSCQVVPLLLTAYSRKRPGKDGDKMTDFLRLVATVTPEETRGIIAGEITGKLGAKLVPPAGCEDLLALLARWRAAMKGLTPTERDAVMMVVEALATLRPPHPSLS